ncbi:hypothetical protein ElyMa_001500900 [Elysia marginata]|uniref:Uncharacterized protein n=1 Tax=Elysia marginata TaxID=1093978 RepID=A0AAV4J6K8_9GAST|nr:hypothetical protein ElyMa_001500900 [Elysia marginata]
MVKDSPAIVHVVTAPDTPDGTLDQGDDDWKDATGETVEQATPARHKMAGNVPYQHSTGSWGSGCRRVSFQLDNIPRSSSSGDFKGRRYIEGDFHHFKYSRIGLSPLLPRQYSMGGAGSPIPGRMFLDQNRFSSLDESSTLATRNRPHSDTSPGRSPGHSPAYSKAFYSADAQALQLQFQQTKQLRQQKLLSQVEAALASGSSTSPTPAASLAPAVSPRRSPCSPNRQPSDELQSLHPNQSSQQHQQSLLASRRSNSDRESTSPRLSPRIPSTEHLRHLSLDNLETSPNSHRHSGQRHARNSPSPSSVLIQNIRDTGAGSGGNVGGASNLSPSPPFKPLLQYDYSNPARKTTPLRRSPLAALVMPSGDGDSVTSSIVPPARDSPPSPFRPIQDNMTGSSPSPPYRPVRTQVAVEVHQIQNNNKTFYTNNNNNSFVNDGNSQEGGIYSGNSSEEQYNLLADRLDRARSYVLESSSSCSSFQAVPLSIPSATHPPAQARPVSSMLHKQNNPQQNLTKQTSNVVVCVDEVETPVLPEQQQPFFPKISGDNRVYFNKNQTSSKDYDLFKITEFTLEPAVAADIDLSPEGEFHKSKSLIRYNDTGSLEKLNDEDDQEMEFLCSAPQPSPTVGDNENRQEANLGKSPTFQFCHHYQEHQCHHQCQNCCQNDQTGKAEVTGREGILAACGKTTRRNRALWRLRATLEEEEECSDTLRMEDMTTSPDDESADCEEGEAQVTTETPNTTSFDSNNAQSDACQSDHHDSGIQFESCCRVAVIPAEHDPHGNDHRELGEHQGAYRDADSSQGAYVHVELNRGGNSPGAHLNLGNTLRPNYENRRLVFRRGVPAKGVAYCGGYRPANSKDENSFDSVETDFDGDREGEVSDTSRPEVTSTSFESSTTTDNTDSTTESQASKLRQMKADSGYKSLETQRQASRDKTDAVTVVGTDGKIVKRGSRASSEDLGDGPTARRDSRGTAVLHPLVLNRGSGQRTLEGSNSLPTTHKPNKQISENGISAKSSKEESISTFPLTTAKSFPASSASPSLPWRIERRSERTASKKRREFSRERQSVQVVYESIHEPDVEGETTAGAVSSSPSTSSQSHVNSLHRSNDDSFEEESSIPSKRSMFARFFKSQGPRFIPGHSSRSHYLSRDYSIDEKTNSIFNEFVRQDVTYQISPLCSKSRGTGSGGRAAGGGGSRFSNRRSPRRNAQQKFQRKHTDPGYFHRSEGDNGDFPSFSHRDRFAHGRRSDSSASSARRISPRDSIEEREDDEIDDIDEAVAMAEKAGRVNCSSVISVGLDMPSAKLCAPSPRFLESQLETVSLQDNHASSPLEGDTHQADYVI